MCLAVPGRILVLEGAGAVVDLAGNTRRVDVSLIEDPAVGDWVMVHAGFALEKVDEESAAETLALLRELLEHEDGGRGNRSPEEGRPAERRPAERRPEEGRPSS